MMCKTYRQCPATVTTVINQLEEEGLLKTPAKDQPCLMQKTKATGDGY
jgi:hypothetical protein